MKVALRSHRSQEAIPHWYTLRCEITEMTTSFGAADLRMPRFALHNFNDWAAQVSSNLHSIQWNIMGYETKPIRTIDSSATILTLKT
jgi:hypothetical protein